MSSARIPKVECEKHHAILAATDVGAAVDFYAKKLGFWVAFVDEPPTFAGVNLGQVQIFLEQGTPKPESSSVYFVVGEVDELYEFQRANGVSIVAPPENKPYGLRDYVAEDLYGHRLVFGQQLLNAGPPIKIERVDVPVRLEKRLAALLKDLAEHKHMSVDSCLEEILLHTNEPLADGVASPHTKTTLEYIQRLKKKHGIDYDSHGSYRFVEQ